MIKVSIWTANGPEWNLIQKEVTLRELPMLVNEQFRGWDLARFDREPPPIVQVEGNGKPYYEVLAVSLHKDFLCWWPNGKGAHVVEEGGSRSLVRRQIRGIFPDAILLRAV